MEESFFENKHSKKISVNLLSCCVSRDVFPDEQEMYDIWQYVALINPMSLYLRKQGKILTNEFDSVGQRKGDNFRRRCLMLDYNNQGFDYIKRRLSDYIIIDMADARLATTETKDGGIYSISMYASRYKEQLALILGDRTVKKSFDDYSKELWIECIKWYCEELLKIYSVDKIILNEVYCVDEYIDKKGKMCSFSNKRTKLNCRINQHLKFVFELVKENLKGCHIIKMPQNVFADASHKLGLLPLHYHHLYYDYAYRALQVLTDSSYTEKQAELERLCNEYSILLDLEKTKTKLKQVIRETKINNRYLDLYEYVFLYYDVVIERIERKFHAAGINQVGLYGDNRSTDIVIYLLQKLGIIIDFVVCSKLIHPNFKKVSPKEMFPETQALIVCTANSESDTRKLKMHKEGLIIDIKELIKSE